MKRDVLRPLHQRHSPIVLVGSGGLVCSRGDLHVLLLYGLDPLFNHPDRQRRVLRRSGGVIVVRGALLDRGDVSTILYPGTVGWLLGSVASLLARDVPIMAMLVGATAPGFAFGRVMSVTPTAARHRLITSTRPPIDTPRRSTT